MPSLSAVRRWALAPLILLTAVPLAVAPLGAAVGAPPISATQEAQLREQMAIGGISPTVQNTLIAKLRSGRALDSTTGQPASVSFEITTSNRVRSIDVFPDGSRRWVDTDRPSSATSSSGVHTASSLTRCTLRSGWYIGCKLLVSDIVSSAGFVIDIKKHNTKSQVRDYRGAWCTNFVGGCTIKRGIVRGVQTSSGPAWARLNYTANIFNGPTVAAEIGVRVARNRITTY